jgi:hypothetical protein
MDPRDRPQPFANGVDCAVCGGLVPMDRIRILARRDDLAFLELACAACRSDSLGIIVAGRADAPDATDSRRTYGEFGAADVDRFRDAPAIRPDDILAARELLAVGGIDALVRRTADDPGRGSA